MDRILDPVRLARVAEAEWLSDDVYSAAAIMDDLQDGLFSEIGSGGAIDPARRSLQRAYVDRLGELLAGEGMNVPAQFASQAYGYRPQASDRSEVQPLARGALMTLQSRVERALSRYTTDSKRAERYHLLDLQARIETILDPAD